MISTGYQLETHHLNQVNPMDQLVEEQGKLKHIKLVQ
jgi:hypothetical protein